MNKVILTGRLTADPELRTSQNGKSVCRFTVACTRNYKNADGEYDSDFLTCIAFNKTAEFVSRYFAKGGMIAVEGSLRTGKYTDKHYSDVTHYTTDIAVDNVEFCGSKNDTNRSPAPAQQVAQKAAAAEIPVEYEELLNEEDMPF